MEFVSLHGNVCRVDVLTRDYTGDAMTLIGAAEPFVTEEDDSTNLLDYVRFTSGNLNVVEEEFGDLDELFPVDDFEHFVEFTVNGALQFTGFIQAVQYDNDWNRGPRELSFPVMSPLGLIDHWKFPDTLSTPVHNIPICELLKYVLTTVGGYDNVYVPGKEVNLDQNISSLAMCPFNNNYSISGRHEGVFKPESFLYLIEGICTAFGWMVHDVPGALVFVDHTWTGLYWRCPVSGLDLFTHESAAVSGADEVTFYDAFAIGSADHQQSYVRPLKEISLSFDGESNEDGHLEYSRVEYLGYSKTPNYDIHDETSEPYESASAWFRCLAEDVYGARVMATTTLTNEGDLTDKGVYVTDSGGQDSTENQILIKYDKAWENSRDTEMFSVNIYNPPSGSVMLKFHLRWGDSIAELGNESRSGSPVMRVELYADDVMIRPAVGTTFPVTFDKEGYGIVGFYGYGSIIQFRHKLQIKFFPWYRGTHASESGIDDGELLGFNQISAISKSKLFDQYVTDRTKKSVIEGVPESPDSGSIQFPLSFFRENSHAVGYDIREPSASDYPQMFVPQHVLKVGVNVLTSLGPLLYAEKIVLNERDYRLIALKNEARDDLWTLMMMGQNERSPEPVPPEPPTPVLPYDAEIEYLESTGTSGFYIDTGISRPSTFASAEIQTKVQFTSTSGRQIAGATNSFYFGVNANRWECNYNTYRGTADANVHDFAKRLTITNNRTYHNVYVDGSSIWSNNFAYNASDFGVNIGIFNITPTFSSGWQARVFSAKVYVNDELVFDGIPVRKDGVGYLYDRVTEELFGNSGTGVFILGNDKNE